jgi:very-short-patch-repair endonuclease
MNNSYYNKTNKELARNLRKNSTLGEVILWDRLLKCRKMFGYQFLRQFTIDDYIVDFVCRKLRLIIEVDGYSHNFMYDKDTERDNKFASLRYTTLRISDEQVKKDLNNVQRTIEQKIRELEEVNPPAPFSKGERERQ